MPRTSRAGKGDLKLRQADNSRFEVGKNIATTPGKVVARSDVAEIIQYEPTTETVLKRPLLICPPWINKFYILDLNPEKSFIRWAVDQGHTVFVISWVNPDERHGNKGWEAYIREGIEFGLDTIEKATGEREVNAIGYCVGGTLLAAALALMAQEGDDRIRSATLFTTQVDFTYAGDLKVFVDEDQVAALERAMNEKGYLEGTKMATAFNMLRSGDLIWPYVVNNYMRGKEPTAVRPALLECQFDAHERGQPLVLPAQLLPREQAVGRRDDARRPQRLARRHQDPDLQPRLARGSYRAVASVFLGSRYFGGDSRIRHGGVRPYRRRHQPAGSRRSTSSGPAANRAAISTNGLPRRPRHPGSWWPHWQKWIEARTTPRCRRARPARRRECSAMRRASM